ncbi:uncharacterized protein An08g09000 [Aspergillus niger]|uniref:Contig An08c0230, genomic contig n=2 Tax=Aspergillus niger TaxID=5061 RepID=A5AB45_ASPNC|nr:uncharacterized protein An08g09000 [Aspergillus niger]CAK96679.1 unnamed protein product [Aspergillus niger]
MADDTAAAEDAHITFNVKSSNDAKYTLTLPSSTSVSDLKEKLASSEYADTPAERQRLIYSGRVLKDNETLATYNIKDGHTIHLVKSAPSNRPPSGAATTTSTSAPGGAAATPAAAGVPTNLAAGTGNNPLAGLTGARYAGFAQLPGAGMFGPDGGMGPPPDTETMLNMLENPQFQSTINEALQNPAMIDMMIQQNPMLREMGPGVRQMMQSPEFRRMLTDPNSIRQMVQMQRAMGGGGLGGGAFPAPGVTNTTPEENRDAQNNTGTTPTPGAAFNPFMPAGLGAGNPFAALFGGNPMMGNPAAGATPPPPQDNRPPEERYAEQLRQLNDMGFFEFERNIEALRRAGGSVQGAVEYLLSHPS